MTLELSPFRQKEEETLYRVASQYREHGYEVAVRPSGKKLPAVLSQFQPDLIARGPGETVVVEVKSRSSLVNEPDMAQLARVVERIPGWCFELIVSNPEIESSVPLSGQLLTRRQILERLHEAGRLEREGHSEAASLLAWSALEAALRHKSRVSGINPQAQSALSLSNSLYSIGAITKPALDELRASSLARNELAHGFRRRATVHASVERFGPIVKQLLSDQPAAG